MYISIINTGGTFNKKYNPLTGELEVLKDNSSLDEIIPLCHNINFEIKNIISKDSLDINNEHRQIILDEINKCQNDKIIIIHGTDTIDLTGKFIKDKVKNKKIVLTAAMIPMSIDKLEASINFSLALGFLNAKPQNGVYLAMHGLVVTCENLKKNKKEGKFYKI